MKTVTQKYKYDETTGIVLTESGKATFSGPTVEEIALTIYHLETNQRTNIKLLNAEIKAFDLMDWKEINL